jgi:SulP family sulfate permease
VRENADGTRRRMRTLTEGTTIGEMGLILNSGRTASVVADSGVEALRLDAATLDALQESDPELLRAVYTMFSRQLTERLLQNERGLRALQG